MPEEPHPALKVKVWIGLLDSSLETRWIPGPLSSPDYPFKVASAPGSEALPFLPAILRAAQDQFGVDFDTARSEAGGGPQDSGDLQLRMTAVEGALASLQEGMERLLQASVPGANSAPGVQPSTIPADGAEPALPGLDASTVAAARTAGIPESQLLAFSRLTAKPNRMMDPGARSGLAAVRKTATGVANPLSESEPEALPPANGPDLLQDTGGLPPLERAVLQMGEVLQRLTREKPKPDLDELLDRAEGVGGGGESSGGVGGRSKAAAYLKLTRMLREEPEKIVESITRLVEEDFSGQRLGPSSNQAGATMRGWLEHRSHIPAMAGRV